MSISSYLRRNQHNFLEFFSSLLCFQERIRAGAVQYPLPFEIQLHRFRMKVETYESLPMPKMLAQVSLITMFKKGFNWNYMMLMPSASPYPQCLIAHSDGIHCLPGIFYFVKVNRLVGMTLFFLLDHFTTLPAQKPSEESDGDSSYALLLLKMPEVLPKRQLCLHES